MIAINTPTGGDKELKSREKSLINGKTNEISKLLGNSKITGNPELVQNLKDYRESWKKFTHIFDKNGMENVVKIADKIHINIDKDEDGGRLIEFKLGDKTYKILNPNLKNHSSNEYVKDIKHRSGIEIDKYYVKQGGMVGDNVDGWENRELAEYVKGKEGEGYHIPKKNEMENLLQELGNLAKLDIDVDQISMLMYLTGLYGTYFMAMEDDITRYSLECHGVRYIGHGINPTYYADLLMISCK